MEEYEAHCKQHLKMKVPVWKATEWPMRMGDCIYHDFKRGKKPSIRKSVHDETNRDTDLSGIHALQSEHFYYFGVAAEGSATKPVTNS